MITEDLHTSSDELTAWLALLRIPLLGPARMRNLLEHYASPAEIFAASADDLRNNGLSRKLIDALARPDWRAAEMDRDWLVGNDCYFVSCRDPRYPG